MGTPEIALQCTDPCNERKACSFYKDWEGKAPGVSMRVAVCQSLDERAGMCTHPQARQAAIRDAVLTVLEGMLGLAPKFEEPCSQPTEGFGDAVLHRLWTQAVGTPGYDKAAWQQLGQLVYAGIAARKKEKP